MNHPVLQTMKARIERFLRDRRVTLLGALGVLALFLACYPTSDVSYSNPQELNAAQWLIEFKTGEARVHLQMRFQRKREDDSYGYSNTGFMIAPEKLTGLTREQAMSSGTNV